MAELCVERHGPSWRYRFELAPVNGKRKRISKSGFRTKTEAIKAGNEAINQYFHTGVSFSPAKLSYSDLLDDYLDANQKSWKETTYYTYSLQIEKIIKPALGSYYISAITAMIIQKYINDLFDKGVSRNTLKSIRTRITSSLDWAVMMDYIKYNPAKTVKLPSQRAVPAVMPNERPHVYLDPEVRKKIFEFYPEGHIMYIPMMLAYRAGLRIGEIFGLTWDDIDFKNGILNVRKQLTYIHKEMYLTSPKYDSVRSFSIDSSLLDALKQRRKLLVGERSRYEEYWTEYKVDDKGKLGKEGKPLDLVCIRENGTLPTPRGTYHYTNRLRRELGLEHFDFHSLRKTHCTELLANGANLKDVQYRMGHKSIDITLEIYTEITKETDSQSLEVLEKLV